MIHPLGRLVVRVLCVALGLVALAGCKDSATTKQAGTATAERPLLEARSVRFVKLEEVSEWSGKAWAAMAEFNLLDATGAVVDRSQWTAAADSEGKNEAPRYAIDGDPKSLWHTPWEGPDPAPPPPHWFVVGLGTPVKVTGFRYLPRQDGTANGAIARYRFYVSEDGTNWGEPVAVGDFASQGAATAEKTVVFAIQTANHPPEVRAPAAQQTTMGQVVSLQVRATDADADTLDYAAEGLPAGLAIAANSGLITGTPITPGTVTVRLSVGDRKGPATEASFAWTVRPSVVDAAPTLAPGEMRFVRLEALTEVNGKPWSTVAEFNLIGPDGKTLSREGWTASADSSDTSDRPASAIDGNPATIWHSQWNGNAPPPPHSLIVDLGHGARIAGFKYLPRQDTLPNGTISRFRFYTSVDGVTWGKPVVEGDFASSGPIASEKTVMVR